MFMKNHQLNDHQLYTKQLQLKLAFFTQELFFQLIVQQYKLQEYHCHQLLMSVFHMKHPLQLFHLLHISHQLGQISHTCYFCNKIVFNFSMQLQNSKQGENHLLKQLLLQNKLMLFFILLLFYNYILHQLLKEVMYIMEMKQCIYSFIYYHNGLAFIFLFRNLYSFLLVNEPFIIQYNLSKGRHLILYIKEKACLQMKLRQLFQYLKLLLLIKSYKS